MRLKSPNSKSIEQDFGPAKSQFGHFVGNWWDRPDKPKAIRPRNAFGQNAVLSAWAPLDSVLVAAARATVGNGPRGHPRRDDPERCHALGFHSLRDRHPAAGPRRDQRVWGGPLVSGRRTSGPGAGRGGDRGRTVLLASRDRHHRPGAGFSLLSNTL